MQPRLKRGFCLWRTQYCRRLDSWRRCTNVHGMFWRTSHEILARRRQIEPSTGSDSQVP